MTHDERISSYIDNELTPEQEQEFLISLAASDGLRKSFRSELVLKKVLHRDEMLTAPPREMRAAVFATLGLGLAGATASRAEAAPATTPAASSAPASHGLLKTLFASKMNALLTATGLSLSALAGYGVHAAIEPQAPQQNVERSVTPQVQTPQVQSAPSVIMPGASQTAVAPDQATTNKSLATKVEKKNVAKNPASRAIRTTHSGSDKALDTIEPTGVSGAGNIDLMQPKVEKK